MLEWEVAEEQPPVPREETKRPRFLPRLIGWLLLLLLLAGLALGGVWLRQRERERALKAELQAVVEIEARLKALGEWEQAEPLLDPEAPLPWKNAYLYHMSHAQPLASVPTVATVELRRETGLALVTVFWPAGDSGGAGVSEQRAYRRVAGQWLRTPLDGTAAPSEERKTAHFVVRGDKAEVARLLEDPAWRFDPEALREHLVRSWPRAWVETRPVTLAVQRQEFGPAVQKTRSRRLLLVDSPTLSYLTATEPLSSSAYYRLQLTDQLILKILPAQTPETFSATDAERYTLLQRQLHWAEARWWALDEEEHERLRARWRATLDGQWRSPLDPAYDPLTLSSTVARERQWLEMNLLLDYLIITYGAAVPGQIAQQLDVIAGEAAFPQQAVRAVFAHAIGATPEEMESAAREYATQSRVDPAQ